MRYRRMGASGLVVSAIGLGGTPFGETVHGSDAIELIHHALARGVTLIDSAITYAAGRSETLIGEALVGRRHEVILVSKVGQEGVGSPLERGLSRRRIMYAVEESLTRLRTDYLDLYLAHKPDPDTPFEETLEAMDRLVRDGKVRYTGGSNYAAWQLAQARGYAQQHSLRPWIAAQNKWNVIDGLDDAELIDAAGPLGFGLMAYMPLASGILTGKYRPGEPAPRGTRLGDIGRISRLLTDDRVRAAERLVPWTRARGHTNAQLGIAWLLAHDACATVLVGARSIQQLDENLAAAAWDLTVAERDEARAIAIG